MKKTSVFLVYLLVITFFLTACLDESQELKLAVCGSYAVPGMFCHNLKEDTFSCDVLENDSYGRILFLYETANTITQKKEKAYVVCQGIDSTYVYFYEDICYVTVIDGTEDITSLKTLNDWNKPLRDSCMSRRKYSISFDLYIMTDSQLYYNDAMTACCQALAIQPSQINTFISLDSNEHGQELFWLTIQQDNVTQMYYVLIDLDYNVFSLRVENTSQDLFRAFKQDSGWIFGKKTD